MVQRGTRCMVACGRVLGDSVWSGCTPFGYMWTGAGGQCVEWVYSLWVHVDGCWGTVCGVGVPPLGACGWSVGGQSVGVGVFFGCLWISSVLKILEFFIMLKRRVSLNINSSSWLKRDYNSEEWAVAVDGRCDDLVRWLKKHRLFNKAVATVASYV